MLPSAVNDTMRDMMAQIRDCGDGIRDGTYTMTAPKITGGTITGSTINNSAIGGTTAAAGAFTTLSATGVTTVQAGTVSLPAITTTGDTNTGIYFPAADTIAFTEGGAESMRIDASGNVGIGVTPSAWNSSWKILQIGTLSSFANNGTNNTTDVWHNAFVDSGGISKYSTTAAASFNRIDGNSYKWFSAASGTAGDTVSWTQTLAVDLNRSLALQGASTQTGTGITFPATQSASSNANTLDDYEQGTWTPAFEAASGSATYTTQTGNYVKIGRQVTVTFYIVVNVSSSLQTQNITGLPFTGSNTNFAGASFSVWENIGGYCTILGLISSANIQLRSTNSATGAPVLNTISVSNGGAIAGSITYFAAD
jgi:hypothetical protein